MPPDRTVLDGSRAVGLVAGRPRAAILLALVAVGAAFALPVPGSALLFFMLPAAMAAARPRLGVLLLPAALLWPFRWTVAGWGGESVFLRLDLALCFGAVLRLAAARRFRETSLYVPLLAFLTAIGVSTCLGIFRRTAGNPLLSLLYFAQLLQLAVIFVLAFSLAPSLRRATEVQNIPRRYAPPPSKGDVCGARTRHESLHFPGVFRSILALRRLPSAAPSLGDVAPYALALPLLAAAGFGMAEYLLPMEEAGTQVYRTFERFWFHGQANHMGGALAFGGIFGAALLTSARWRGLGGALMLACVPALLTAHSREGVAALGFGLVLLLGCRFPRALTIFAVVFLLCLSPIAGRLWLWLTPSGSSLFDRMCHWESAVHMAVHYPLWGLGLAARHRRFYDNQYIMWLAEGGSIGLILFFAWLLHLSRALWRRRDSAVALGVLCGLGALMLQGMAAVAFIITPLAGPMYWAAGYALGKDERGWQRR